MGQWGFGKNGDLAGTVCLFTGEPGTGKTLAAEAVGFETGKPLKVGSSAALHSIIRFACAHTIGTVATEHSEHSHSPDPLDHVV